LGALNGRETSVGHVKLRALRSHTHDRVGRIYLNIESRQSLRPQIEPNAAEPRSF